MHGQTNIKFTRSETYLPAFCLPKMPHGLAWDRKRASAVRDRWLSFLAMAQPFEDES